MCLSALRTFVSLPNAVRVLLSTFVHRSYSKMHGCYIEFCNCSELIIFNLCHTDILGLHFFISYAALTKGLPEKPNRFWL